MAAARGRTAVRERELDTGFGPARFRRPVDPRLRGLLGRQLLGYHHAGIGFASWLEPPRPELTLMIDVDGWIDADGERLPEAWIGGLTDRHTIVGVGDTYGSIDLKLSPLGAYRLLGMPLSELEGRCVALGDVFGRAGERLGPRLRETGDWNERFDLLEAFLLHRLTDAPDVDPAVAWTWQRLVQSAGRVRIETLAAEVGASRRHLGERFRRQIGLAPKTTARLLRFHAVCRAIERSPGRWAELAFAAGYADQSHLNREFRQLAGVTPTEFVARRLPEGGLVGDGVG